MELLSVQTAKVGWYFDFGELNRKGKDVFSDLIGWVSDFYNFEKHPASITDLDEATKSLSFKVGSFQVSEEVFISVEMNIYSDGIIANSWSSTEATESFLENLLHEAAKEFHLNYSPHTIQKKTFLSELNVKCEHPLAAINPKVIEIADKIAKLAGRDCELGGLQFWFDPRINPQLGPFRLERKVNTSPADNRYYSSAPLSTSEHLGVLSDLESLLCERMPVPPRAES